MDVEVMELRLRQWSPYNNPLLNDESKRFGILAMLTFIELNGMKVQCGDNEHFIRRQSDYSSFQFRPSVFLL